MSRALALAAFGLSLGTVAAFVVLLNAFTIPVPLPPLAYLGALVAAVGLAVWAVVRGRSWLSMASLIVSVAVLGLAGFFNFVAARVPVAPTAFVVGRPAPELTLPDAAGRPVTLAEYRGKKPVVLIFYRGYW